MTPISSRLLLAGLAGGLTLNLLMLLTFRLLGFGWQGGGVLLNPAFQSPKLWPPGVAARGLRLGGLVFFLSLWGIFYPL
jgi:hypothetical protein